MIYLILSGWMISWWFALDRKCQNLRISEDPDLQNDKNDFKQVKFHNEHKWAQFERPLEYYLLLLFDTRLQVEEKLERFLFSQKSKLDYQYDKSYTFDKYYQCQMGEFKYNAQNWTNFWSILRLDGSKRNHMG